jgi:hypothetical protein
VSESTTETPVGPEPEAGVEPAPESGVEPEAKGPELDPETAARRTAALAHIRQFGDPVLRTRSTGSTTSSGRRSSGWAT